MCRVSVCSGILFAVSPLNPSSGRISVIQRQEVAMSSLVLSQLLNPESGVDRKAAGNIPDLATDGKRPSRYDEIVRHQEKRLARQRVEDRARAKADEQERQVELRRSDRAASRQDSGSSPAEQRQAESRNDRNDGNAMASKPSRGKQVSESKNPEDVADPK